MNSRNEIELKNFFIFNSTYCIKEGEEQNKILFYFPPTEDLNTQINNVGLVEAIIKFTGNFKSQCDTRSLHTLKTRQLYYQPEKNFWMTMTLNLPFKVKSKEEVEQLDYMEDEIQDEVYNAVLKQAYDLYYLFFGSFSDGSGSDTILLKSKLMNHFSPYLKSIKLAHCDIMNIFNGIHFLPLNKQNFLNVQCFINLLECTYKFIKYTAVLFNDCLIW
ncbi:vacuolar fusion protein CCZ1 homolog [Agrilus planipennis]|nr:vacuolar fusion protein CCZ1 homolog [Agrilus planipennis]XP_025831387.1 vacuolar fusion protein CCZ1 homolog [Agrilus planipennis]